MNHPFATAIRLNGALVVLSTHKTAADAAEALHTSRIRWADAFVVAR